jgi:large subunit ribosomal protein L34
MKTKIRRSKRKHLKETGFRYRMKTRGGRNILKRRRRIGRRLTPKA